MACIHFFKLCPQKCLIFADMNLYKFFCHAKLISFSIGLLEIHMNNQKRKLSLPPKVIVWCWKGEHRWLKRDWMVNQLQSHFMQKLQPGTFSDFQCQTRMPFVCNSGLASSLHKMGKNLVKLQPSSNCDSRILPRPIMLFVDGRPIHSQRHDSKGRFSCAVP